MKLKPGVVSLVVLVAIGLVAMPGMAADVSGTSEHPC